MGVSSHFRVVCKLALALDRGKSLRLGDIPGHRRMQPLVPLKTLLHGYLVGHLGLYSCSFAKFHSLTSVTPARFPRRCKPYLAALLQDHEVHYVFG